MFSGIVDAVGDVREVRPTAGGCVLRIAAPGYWSGVAHGGSIAVDGVCLTVTQATEAEATFDVVAETLRRSTLGRLRPGGSVNLQKSLSAGQAIDGHFVQGHVDAIAEVARVEQSEKESIWWFRMDAEAMAYVIPKGSIAIDGISLTIAEIRNGIFSVALIPTTLERTTLGNKREGDVVNIETDIVSRTIVEHLRRLMGGEAQSAEAITRIFPRSGNAK